jgi:hypothetical protein
MARNEFFQLLFIYVLTFFASSCGTNVFKSLEKQDPAEEATIAMEQGKPEKAIVILNRALAESPQNYQLLSLLSSATAQKYGIDTIDIALKMADNEKTSEQEAAPASEATSSNGITGLFSALPEATDDHINGISEAISIMESIPKESRTAADNFKLTMMHTALLGLNTKKFDKDGDGQISPVEKLQISVDDAVSILNNLMSAEEIIASGVTADSANESGASVAQISTIRAAIEAAPGATDQEKLTNYLSSIQSQAQ